MSVPAGAVSEHPHLDPLAAATPQAGPSIPRMATSAAVVATPSPPGARAPVVSPLLSEDSLLELLERPLYGPPKVAKTWSSEAVYGFALGGGLSLTRPRPATSEPSAIPIRMQANYSPEVAVGSSSAEVVDLNELLEI